MPLVIPTPTAPHTEQTTNLDGTIYVFRFDYNQRQQRWTFDLRNTDGQALASGIPLVGGVDLLAPHAADVGMPPGLLYMMTAPTEDPTIVSIRDTSKFLLVYLTEAEVASVPSG